MNNKEHRLSIITGRFLLALIIFALMAQQPNGFFLSSANAATSKTTVKLNKTKATLTVKKSITLKATVSGRKGTVKWSSSKKSVATVSSKGKVTAKKKGTATITASVNGAKATCKITVKAKIPNISAKTRKMTIGKAAKYLGLNQRIVVGKYVYYLRKGKKIKNYWNPDTPYMQAYKSCEKHKGHWNIIIPDKTITFDGVKVGMKKSTANKKLFSKGWYIEDDQSSDIFYTNDDFGGSFSIEYKNGRVNQIWYEPVDD